MKPAIFLRHAISLALFISFTSCELFQDLQPDPPGQDVGTIIWEFEFNVDGLGVGSDPAIGPDGTVYFAAQGNMATWHPARVYAVDPNGNEKWHSNDLDHIGLGSQVGVDPSGNILAIGFYTLYSINPNDGSFNWTWEVPTADNNHYQIGNMAIGSDGSVYISHIGAGSYQRKVFGISNSGQTLWIATHDDILNARHLTIGPNGNLYAQWSDWDPVTNTTPYLVVCIDPATGSELWRTEIQNGSTSRGMAFDASGNIIFSLDAYPGDDKLLKIDRANGTILIEKTAYPGFPSISSNGDIIINTPNFGPQGYTANMDPKWNTEYGAPGMYGVAIDQQGKFYTFVHDNVEGTFKCFSSDGDAEWSLQGAFNANATPAISNDKVIYIVGGQKLYAIQGDSGPSGGPWPRQHGSNRNSRNAGF